MSADLPQQRGASDLVAAAQLVARRPDPVAASVRLVELADDYRAMAAELGRTGAIAEPAPPIAVDVVDHLVGLQVPEAVAQLQTAAGALEVFAGDPCSCPPSPICASSCGHCAALPDEVPCPHDTDPPAAVVDVVDQDDDDVDEVDQDPPAVWDHPAGSVCRHGFLHYCPTCGTLAGPAPFTTGHAGDQLVPAVDWPAVLGKPLHEVAAAQQPASPSTGHLPTLDWSSRHDARSLSYGVREHLLTAGQPLQLADVLLPVGPVLDQGAEGQCVGMAVVDAANVLDELAGDLDQRLLGGEDATRLYRLAQSLDDRPGDSYSGTSVLAGMLAGRQAGLWQRFLWAFGTRDIAGTVMRRRPVVVGVPWLSGMYETGPGGRVDVVGDDNGVGHCLVIVGLRMTGPQGQPGPWFVWLNSWGSDYGDAGLGYVHHRDLARLLAGHGEAAVPLPTGATS